MILIILAALMVIGIIILIIDNHSCSFNGFLVGVGLILAIIFGAGTLVFGLAAGIEYINAETDKITCIAEAQMLQDQIDKGNPNGEVLVKAIAFNTDIIYHKEITHNFWTGILFPDFYDEVPLVNLE